MDFSAFESRARSIFESVPVPFRQGISGLIVHKERAAHPLIDDFVTLGECVTDPAAAAFATSSAEIRSQVHLYHGSFVHLAAQDAAFDWEGELRETILHEIQHDLEERAGVDPLGDQDRIEEQNERRRAGLPFDPHFYRFGESPSPGEHWVGLDAFLEVSLSAKEMEKLRLNCGGKLPIHWGEDRFEIDLPAKPQPVNFLSVDGGWEDEEGNSGDLFVVLLLKRGVFS